MLLNLIGDSQFGLKFTAVQRMEVSSFDDSCDGSYFRMSPLAQNWGARSKPVPYQKIRSGFVTGELAESDLLIASRVQKSCPGADDGCGTSLLRQLCPYLYPLLHTYCLASNQVAPLRCSVRQVPESRECLRSRWRKKCTSPSITDVGNRSETSQD
jgi:hypothetical protein